MEYIRKLPYILAALMTMIIGTVSFLGGAEQKDIYLRMLLCMITFLLIGMVIRSILVKLIEGFQEKNKEDISRNLDNETEESNPNGSVIDFRVDDTSLREEYEEEFTPLKVSQVIRSSLKEDEQR